MADLGLQILVVCDKGVLSSYQQEGDYPDCPYVDFAVIWTLLKLLWSHESLRAKVVSPNLMTLTKDAGLT